VKEKVWLGYKKLTKTFINVSMKKAVEK